MEFLQIFLYYVIPFLIVLTILVFVHEFGHFIVARAAGVKVEVFSIGFGKELAGFNDKHGTRWKFSLIPLGGYVKMFGDKGAASNSDDELLKKLSEEDKKVAFHCKKLSQRAAIVAAGPLANYLLAIIIFSSFIYFFGQPIAKPIVSDVIQNSPAMHANIKKGDLIIKMDDEKIESFSDIRNFMALNLGKKIKVTVKRDDQLLIKELSPEKHIETDDVGNEITSYRIGIATNNIQYEKKGLFDAILGSISQCYEISVMSLKGIAQIILGERSVKELGGPVKIAQYSAKSAENGLISLIWFIGLMSVNLGLLNLLPIPVLDGGHLLVYAIEFIFGEKISQKFANIGFQIGFILIMLLTAMVTFNDIASLKIFRD